MTLLDTLREREISLFEELKEATGEDHNFILNEITMVRAKICNLLSH